MTYELEFLEEALREWGKINSTIQEQFKKKLKERLSNPKIKSAKLSGSNYRYKIKLKSAGYRLVYEVIDNKMIVLVIAIGKRERNQVYKLAAKRL